MPQSKPIKSLQTEDRGTMCLFKEGDAVSPPIEPPDKSQINGHKDGCFNFDETESNMKDKEELMDALKEFDRNNLGFISASDLRLILSIIEPEMSFDEIEDMVKEVDVESNGRITFKVIVETLGKP